MLLSALQKESAKGAKYDMHFLKVGSEIRVLMYRDITESYKSAAKRSQNLDRMRSTPLSFSSMVHRTWALVHLNA